MTGQTAVPTAAIHAKLSPQALALFGVLCAYFECHPSDAWPSRRVLADMIGFSQPKSVDKYVTELITAGFVLTDPGVRTLTHLYERYKDS